MKWLFFFLTCSAALASGAELSGVRSVYVMPMAHGLDQYLVSRLTSNHVFQVVTDPKRADAVLSDRVGSSLENKLDDMTTPAPKPDAKPKETSDESPVTALSTTVNKLDSPALNSSWGRAKGTVFLVDATSRQVLWSVYETPKGTDSQQLDRTASDIVSRLKKDLANTIEPKKKK
ncbi:MAG TPA: hypothetical protein VG675_04485 [Bryobacteraceae bacterium]|nr:hypothetical protein [Bryobacteraceae bacterium]